MLSLAENTKLHKGLKIISCHTCIFSHLKGKPDFNPTAHQPKTSLQRSRSECAWLGTLLQQDCSNGRSFLLSAIKNLSSYILSKKAS